MGDWFKLYRDMRGGGSVRDLCLFIGAITFFWVFEQLGHLIGSSC